MVRVRADSGYGGTGTLIDERGYVITCNHVVEGAERATIVWADGSTSNGPVIHRDTEGDLAIVQATPPDGHSVLPVADVDQWPPESETVDLIGYGGGQLHQWRGDVRGYALTGRTEKYQTLSIATRSINGDSGGPIVHQGRLVGVLWGGPLAGPRGPMTSVSATCCIRIRHVFRSIFRQRGPPDVVPPEPTPAPPVVAYPPPEIDYDILAAKVVELMGDIQGPAGARGPTGPQGPAGEPGRDPDIAAIVAEVLRQSSASVIVTVQPIP